MINSLYKQFQHWSATGSVYLISDPRFDDVDCKIMCADWPSPAAYIQELKKHIRKTDTLICLGDVGNPTYFNELKCYKVLICGNHDKGASIYEPYFDEVYTGPLFISPQILLSHEPIDLPFVFNIHGHCHCTKILGDKTHLNIAADVRNFKVISLSEVIKNGMIKDIPTIHQLAINYQKMHSLVK